MNKEKLNLITEGIANDLRNALVDVVPVDTGRLKTSIKVITDGNVFHISMVDYALHVEFGTKAHIIRPKNKKSLAFAKTGGKLVHHKDNTVSTKFEFGGKSVLTDAVFAKVVHHPGTQPQPFIRNTLSTKMKGIIIQNIKRYA